MKSIDQNNGRVRFGAHHRTPRSRRSRPTVRWSESAVPPTKRGRPLLLLVVLLALATASAAAQSNGQVSADALLAQMEEALYPDSFFMRATLQTNRPDRRDTSITMESRHKESVGTLIEVIAPARTRGTRFLQKEDSLWMYNPRAGGRRAIRLSPRESFQGSVFSNNDVGDPTYTDDYSASYGEQETIDHPSLGTVATQVLIGEATHDEAAYGRIVVWVRTTDAAPVQMELYAKSGILFKRMSFRDFKELAGRQRPSVIRMDSLIQENTYSIVTIEALERRDELPDRLFTQANLTR